MTPDPAPVPPPAQRPPPASVEEHLLRLMDEMSLAKTHREKVTTRQAYLQAGASALKAAVLRDEIEDPDVRNEVDEYVRDLLERIEATIIPKGVSPFTERMARIGEGIHPAEEWDAFYEEQVQAMAKDLVLVGSYLDAAGVLQPKQMTLDRLIREEERLEGVRLTRKEQREIQIKYEETEASANGGAKEPEGAHGPHDEPKVSNAGLRTGKGWQVVE